SALASREAALRETGVWPKANGPQQLTYDDLLRWYQKHLGEPFDITRKSVDIYNPNLTGNPIRETARFEVNTRELVIMGEIDRWNTQGADVFIGYGQSHYTIQKPFLDQKYGQPIIYRHGQMSGDLLMGENLTPADIRRGITAAEQRIADTDDPQIAELWTEELHTLETELESRTTEATTNQPAATPHRPGTTGPSEPGPSGALLPEMPASSDPALRSVIAGIQRALIWFDKDNALMASLLSAENVAHRRQEMYLLYAMAADAAAGGIVAELLGPHSPPDSKPSSHPVFRLLQAVNHRALSGLEPDVARWHTVLGGQPAHTDAELHTMAEDVLRAIREHASELAPFLLRGTQINDPARSRLLLPVEILAARITGLPLRVFSIGACGMLDARAHLYRYQFAGNEYGNPEAATVIDDRWSGRPDQVDQIRNLLGVWPNVIEVAGADLDPLQADNIEDQRRLAAGFVGTDNDAVRRIQTSFIDAQRAGDTPIDQESALTWLPRRLAEDRRGSATIVWDSMLRRYLTPEQNAELDASITRAGAAATPQNPLIYAKYEIIDGAEALTVKVYSGTETREFVMPTQLPNRSPGMDIGDFFTAAGLLPDANVSAESGSAQAAFSDTSTQVPAAPGDHSAKAQGAIAAVSDLGVGPEHGGRDSNEDAFGFVTVTVDGVPVQLAAVADGVGGSARGGEAAQTAVRAAITVMSGASAELGAAGQFDPLRVVRRGMSAARAAVGDLAETPGQANSPDSTVALAVMRAGTLVIDSAGDTRVYWLPVDGGTPKQLSVDDTIVPKLIADGMPEGEALQLSFAGQTTRSLGRPLPKDAQSHAAKIPLRGRGYVLIATDGVWHDTYQPESLAAIVQQAHKQSPGDHRAIAAALNEHAHTTGNHDNMTNLLIWHEPAAPTPDQPSPNSDPRQGFMQSADPGLRAQPGRGFSGGTATTPGPEVSYVPDPEINPLAPERTSRSDTPSRRLGPDGYYPGVFNRFNSFPDTTPEQGPGHPPGRSEGLPDIPEAGNRAAVERHIANERRTAALAEELGITVDELRTLMVAELRQAFRGDIDVRVKSQTIHRIIQSGRFKTEYELIGQRNILARGMLAKRSALEQELFGYPTDLPAEQRPIYGYIRTTPYAQMGANDPFAEYGDVDLVLKREVAERTTATVGSPWGVSSVPSSVVNPQPESFGATPSDHSDLGYFGLEGIGRDYAGDRFVRNSYIEAHIHRDGDRGDLTIADVARAVFHREPPDAGLQEALAEAGIPWSMAGQDPATAGARSPEHRDQPADGDISTSSTQPARVPAVVSVERDELTDLFTAYGNDNSSELTWTGANSTYSVELPDGRTLWIFS
ncbi:DUF2332 family protein, partial [Nocardia cyriacigeorgica]|uniref:DUF2332 family protein n=1 Tax=Nocardia cyriacigeorgica TaxID=135487 RepID=UPI002453E239